MVDIAIYMRAGKIRARMAGAEFEDDDDKVKDDDEYTRIAESAVLRGRF